MKLLAIAMTVISASIGVFVSNANAGDETINLAPHQTFDSTIGAAPGETANWTLAAPAGWTIKNSDFTINPDQAIWKVVANAALTTPHKYKAIPGPNTPEGDLQAQVQGMLKPPDTVVVAPPAPPAAPPQLDFTVNMFVKNIQAISLGITTIQDNVNWPGARPAGFETRLGYPAGAAPSDDQVIFDVVLQVQGGLLAQFNGVFGGLVQMPVGGSLANATAGDKEWITLAMLKRSANTAPGGTLTQDETIALHDGQDWRLWNELGIAADITPALKFQADVQIPTKIEEIGPTPLTLTHITAQVETTLPILGHVVINVTTTFQAVLGGNIADAGDENGKITGGKTGDSSITHRNAGRIGPLLEAYERAMIPKRAAPFANEVTIFPIAGPDLDVIGQGSQDATLRWPSADIYKWNKTQARFERVSSFAQAANPFNWISQFGSPWN